MFVTYAYFSEPKIDALAWLLFAVLLFFGGAIGVTVTRLAGYPRLSVRGHMLIRESYFAGPTTVDLSQLGQARAFATGRRTCIGFPKLEEEYALRMTGQGHKLDRFTAAAVLDVAPMVGLSLKSAALIANEINKHRSRVPSPHLEYEEIKTIAARTARKRAWAVAIIAAIGAVGVFIERLLN